MKRFVLIVCAIAILVSIGCVGVHGYDSVQIFDYPQVGTVQGKTYFISRYSINNNGLDSIMASETTSNYLKMDYEVPSSLKDYNYILYNFLFVFRWGKWKVIFPAEDSDKHTAKLVDYNNRLPKDIDTEFYMDFNLEVYPIDPDFKFSSKHRIVINDIYYYDGENKISIFSNPFYSVEKKDIIITNSQDFIYSEILVSEDVQFKTADFVYLDKNGNIVSGPTPTPVPTPSPTPDPGPLPVVRIKGDVNGDGRITSADYLILKKYFAGDKSWGIGEQY